MSGSRRQRARFLYSSFVTFHSSLPCNEPDHRSEFPELDGIAAQDLLPILRGEKRDLIADKRKFLLERWAAPLQARSSGKARPPHQSIGSESVIYPANKGKCIAIGILF